MQHNQLSDILTVNEIARLFQSLLNLSHNYIHIYNIQTQEMVFSTINLNKLYGQSDADMDGSNENIHNYLYDSVDSSILKQHQTNLLNSKEGELHELIIPFRYLDKKIIWLQSHATVCHRDDYGNSILIACMITNITDDVMLSKELNIFRKFADSSSQGFVLTDTDNNIVYTNPALNQLLIADNANGLAGSKFMNYLPSYDREYFEKVVIPHVNEKGKWEGEFYLRSTQSTIFLAYIRITILEIDYSESNYYCYSIEDISKDKELEEELLRYQNTLEDIVTERTNELIKNQNLISATFKKAPLILFSINSEGIFTLSDGEYALAKLGLVPGQVVGLSVFDIYKDVPVVIEGMKRALKGDEVNDIFFINGMYFETLLKPIFDKQSKIESVIGVAFEVTNRIEAERAIKESETKFKSLFNVSNDVLAIHDLNGRIIELNQSGIDLLNDISLDRNDNSVFDPDLKINMSYLSEIIESLNKNPDTRIGTNIYLKNGVKIPVDFRAQYIDYNGELSIFSQSRNVTELIEKQEKLVSLVSDLVESKSFIETVINASPDLIFVKDKLFRYTLVNDSFANMMGRIKEEMIGLNDLQIGFSQELVFGNPDKSITGFRHDDIRVINGETIYNHYDPATDEQGKIHIFDTIKIPLRNLKGEIIGVLGIAREVTELIEKEYALKKYNSDLERSNRELQEFAYIASHDLQEPLRKIQSFGDIIRISSGEDLPIKTKDYIDRMINASSRMQTLINDLLNYSRVSSQGTKWSMASLNELITLAIDDLEISIKENQAEIIIDELPKLGCDSGQFHRLFLNIISNSLKFRKPNTKPIIRIRYELDKNGIHPSRFKHRIIIEDNGIGFDQIYADKVFTIFQRLHGRNEYSGTGLGLAIVKKIVTRHNGVISAIGEPGVGATFIIELPYLQYDLSNSNNN